jgi:predicted RNA-binding Zn-ribbon protein involved in translation (DUF1610 family)
MRNTRKRVKKIKNHETPRRRSQRPCGRFDDPAGTRTIRAGEIVEQAGAGGVDFEREAYQGMETKTYEEVVSEMTAQGVPLEHVAFKCPMCGTIQSAADLMSVGAGKNYDEVAGYIGFSCIGRWTHHKPPPAQKGTQYGCNWTLGGLFQMHDLVVISPDGEKHPSFLLATPEEARAHMRDRNTVKD